MSITLETKSILQLEEIHQIVNLIDYAQTSSDAFHRSYHRILFSIVEAIELEASFSLAFNPKLIGVAYGYKIENLTKDNPVFYISDIAVNPDYREKGTARAMIKELESFARTANYNKICADIKFGSKSYNLFKSSGYVYTNKDSNIGFQKFFKPL